MDNEGISLFCCDMCHLWCDLSDIYENIIIGKRTDEEGRYERLTFCRECGKELHNMIKKAISKKGSVSRE